MLLLLLRRLLEACEEERPAIRALCVWQKQLHVGDHCTWMRQWRRLS
jgi:hypothetical protein